MLDSFFYWVGMYYRETLYLGGAKAAGIICSYADIFGVAVFIRVMDIVHQRPASKVRYTVLLIFAALTPTLLIPSSSFIFFVMQFVVLAPPYLILVYTAVTEAKYFVAHIKNRLRESGV